MDVLRTKLQYKKFALLILIGFSVNVDIINGIIGASQVSVSPGALLRGLVLLIGLAVLFRKKSALAFKGRLFLMIVVLLLITGQLVGGSQSQYGFDLYNELNKISKLIFTPLLAFLIFSLIPINTSNKYEISNYIFKLIIIGGVIESLAVLIPYLLGFGVSSYRYSFGTKGILMSQNEISLSLLVSSIVATYMLITSKHLIYLFSTLIISLALFNLGSRVGVVGAVLGPIVVAIICLPFVFEKLPFNKSIFMSKIGVILIVSCFGFIIGFAYVLNHVYLINKFQILFETGGLARMELQDVGVDILKSRDLLSLLFGEGNRSFMSELQYKGSVYVGPSVLGKNAEVDWVDIAGSYGVIVSLLIHWFYAYFSYKSARYVFLEKSILYVPVFVSFSVFLIHSLLGGHAIMAPLPGTFIAAMIALILYHSKNYHYFFGKN